MDSGGSDSRPGGRERGEVAVGYTLSDLYDGGTKMDHPTRYYGIWRQYDDHTGAWYLVTDLGHERRYDYRPSDAEVDTFRDDVAPWRQR